MTERYSKHLIRLYIGDYDLLARLRPDERPNKIIRELIHKYIERLALIKAGGKVDGNDS